MLLHKGQHLSQNEFARVGADLGVGLQALHSRPRKQPVKIIEMEEDTHFLYFKGTAVIQYCLNK